MSHEKIAAKFDEWAQSGRDEGMEKAHGDVVRQVVEKMGVAPGEKILDLGCGNGWATRLLAKTNAGVQAIGVDVAPQMIARADELHSFTIRARYDLGRFEHLEFKDGEFARVFSMEALYYAKDLNKALSEAFRVLKPGGSADIIVDHYHENEPSHGWGEEMGLDLHLLAEDEWRVAFERAGFAPVTTTRVQDSRGADAPDPASECESGGVPKGTWAGSLWIHAKKP